MWLCQHRAACWGWPSVPRSVGAEASTGDGLGSLLTACSVASTGWGLTEEARAPGNQVMGRHFGGKPQKRKAGGFKLRAPGFSEGGKSRRHSTAEA